MTSIVYTIGHSTHTLLKLVGLLKQNAIGAVADVRSSPYSRMNPQFNREHLRDELRAEGIAYVFLGEELGARTQDPTCYENGKVQYDRLARTELFRRGLERIKKGNESYRLALLCAEKDPLFCHRMVLISRCLTEEGFDVKHILENGALESQEQTAERLLQKFRMPGFDMFRPKADIVAEAFRRQAEAIAYQERPTVDATVRVRR